MHSLPTTVLRVKTGNPRWLAPLVISACALALGLMDYKTHFFSGRTYEFCHYAEIGRNVLAGQGLKTRVAIPSALAYYDRLGVSYADGWPVLDRFPLYPYLLALSLGVFGLNDFAVFLVAAATFALCAAVVFVLGREFFSPTVGVLAAATFMCCVNFFFLMEGGYVCFLFAFLICLLNLLLFRDEKGRTWGRCVALGVVSGLAWLTRPNFVLLLPVYALYLAWPKGNGRIGEQANGRAGESANRRMAYSAAAVYLVAFLVTVSPMLVYNAHHFGRALPQISLSVNITHKTAMEDMPWSQYDVYEPSSVLLRHSGQLVRKWLGLFLNEFCRYFFVSWNLQFVIPFFLVGLFGFYSERARPFVRFSLLLFIVHQGIFLFLRYEPTDRYHIWFAPTILLVGFDCLLRLTEKFSKPKRWAVIALVLAYNVGSTCYSFADFGYRRYVLCEPFGGQRKDENFPAIAGLVEPHQFVATNEPAQVAWYAGRPALALPERVSVFTDQMARAHRIDFLYLSPRIIGSQEWAYHVLSDKLQTFTRETPYRVQEVFPNGGILLRRSS